MQPADRPEFVEILEGLAAIKPGAKLTPAGLRLWWNSMSAWPIAEFREAASHLARSVEFMPSPFQFEQLRKAGRMTAGEAWALVLEHARSGADEPEDPLTRRSLRAMGGLRTVSMSQTDRTHFLEKRFCEHYEALQDVTEVREALPAIADTPLAQATAKRLISSMTHAKRIRRQS